MSRIVVAGGGAFGTALAVTLARAGRDVCLWLRDVAATEKMQVARKNTRYLPGCPFPDGLRVSHDAATLKQAEVILIAVPTQSLRGFVQQHQGALAGKTCVLCCKGIEKGSGLLPPDLLRMLLPDAGIAVLTGPGFASEIATGHPTALTLASIGPQAAALQTLLSTGTLRLYLSDDLTGAALGGALKNVVAIGCGITIGAGLGESARAALMTRGYAEIRRLAVDMGARPDTLSGLSGVGDLALTCGSDKSRNFSLGYRLGAGRIDRHGQQSSGTVEGMATAQASLTLAQPHGIEMPVAETIARVLDGRLAIPEAVNLLLTRPLRSEV